MMDAEMQGIFDRMKELLDALGYEYESCAKHGEVTERAKNLFHEVLVKVRSALDFAMHRVFVKYTTLDGDEKGKAERQASFLICETAASFDKKLQSLGLDDLQVKSPDLYAKLKQVQPFSTNRKELVLLRDLSNLGKHARLAAQDCRLRDAKKVTSPDGTIAVFTEGSGPVDKDGNLTGFRPDCEVEDIVLAMFNVHHDGGGISTPSLFCLSLVTGVRRYLADLLPLI